MRITIEPEHLDSPKPHPCMGADVPSLCTDVAVHRVGYFEDRDNDEAGHAHLCGPHALFLLMGMLPLAGTSPLGTDLPNVRDIGDMFPGH